MRKLHANAKMLIRILAVGEFLGAQSMWNIIY